MFCMKNLYALYHGKNKSFKISLTPSSLNLKFSALTTGELIRYKRSASAPNLLTT